MKKLLAVDGNSILNRAFYGIRPLTTSFGLPTNAIYGFVNIIHSHIESLQPDYIAVAFDLKAPTHRHEKYPLYKANRKGMPEELAAQLPYAKQAVEAMGMHELEMSGWEADDILGTLSSISEANGVEAYLLTGDRDSLQLISDTTRVLLATTGETVVYDRDKFFEKYGTEPIRLIDIKALMGDSSDNIPGVPGVGEKTALKLISDYGTLDGVYDGIENKDIAKGAKNKLITGKESAYISYDLATICREVPISKDISDYEYNGMKNSELTELFTYLQFGALIKKFGLDEAQISALTVEFEKANGIPKLDLASVWCEDDAVYVYDGEHGYVLDASEASDVYGNVGIICSDSKRLYAEHPDCDIRFDVSLAGYVLDSSIGDYSVSRLALGYLGISQVKGGEQYAVCIFELYKKLTELMSEQKCDALFYNIELPLARVLSDMEKEGFCIDRDGLLEFGDRLEKQISDLTERIYALCGETFNINSPKQLGEVLFEKLRLPAQKKTKTGYSTNAEVLESLAPYHPVIDEILQYRNVMKLKGTYVDGLLKCADEDGVIHTSFNQTVTATGRLSSAEPNLQNIPIRTEEGRALRKFFIPKKSGRVLIDSDYSQIELRLLAAISGDERMIEAFNSGQDIHRQTASQVFDVPIEAVTDQQRKRAKAVSFGIVYGISDFSLAKDIGVSRPAAKQYIENYLHRYPLVSEYLENIKREAADKGYVSTLLGRRRYIPEMSSGKKTIRSFGERVAMNSPIQGTAADIIKIAMVNTFKALKDGGYKAKLILQVHDELIIEAPAEEAEAVKDMLVSQMENALLLPVKMSVETSVGENWYDCK